MHSPSSPFRTCRECASFFQKIANLSPHSRQIREPSTRNLIALRAEKKLNFSAGQEIPKRWSHHPAPPKISGLISWNPHKGVRCRFSLARIFRVGMIGGLSVFRQRVGRSGSRTATSQNRIRSGSGIPTADAGRHVPPSIRRPKLSAPRALPAGSRKGFPTGKPRN